MPLYRSAYGTAFGRGGVSENTWLENMYNAQDVCPYFGIYNDSAANAGYTPAGTDPSWAFYDDLHIWRKPQIWLNSPDPSSYHPATSNTLAFGSPIESKAHDEGV